MLESLPERVNSNAPLVHRGRWVNLTFTLGIGDADFLITVTAGWVTKIEPRPLATNSGVSLFVPSAKHGSNTGAKYHPATITPSGACCPGALPLWMATYCR